MKISDKIIDRKSGDSVILLNLETGDMFTLNETGAHIWSALKTTSRSSDIADSLVDQFEVTQEDALTTVDAFLIDLKDRQILTV